MMRFFRFAIVGMVNTSVDFGIYATLTLLLHMHPLLANAISYSSGVITSFIGNRDFTFRRPASAASNPLRFAAFYGANVAGLLLASAAILIFDIWFGPVVAKAFSIPLTMTFNFLMARRILSARLKRSDPSEEQAPSHPHHH